MQAYIFSTLGHTEDDKVFSIKKGTKPIIRGCTMVVLQLLTHPSNGVPPQLVNVTKKQKGEPIWDHLIQSCMKRTNRGVLIFQISTPHFSVYS